MRRLQFFEFCDQAWLPKVIREAFHDCLSFNYRLYRPYTHVADLLTKDAARLGYTELLDLGSGAGGHMTNLQARAATLPHPLPRFVLSDLFPHVDEWTRLRNAYGESKVGFIPQPLDIMVIPSGLSRHWSMFAAFHHFPPSMAREVLKQFVQHADSFHIVEHTERSALSMLALLSTAVTAVIAPFFARKFSIGKLLVTTLIPIVPLILLFDGIVSCLRTYTPEEIRAMLPEEMLTMFELSSTRVRIPLTPLACPVVTIERK